MTTIDPRVDIGHVHLKVSDLERALDFYCGVLGFEIMARYGEEAAFISAGGYHHHLGLNTWESKGGSPPPPGATGLFHTAIRYPDRPTLADAVRRVMDAGIPLTGASDHGVSEAIYLNDPDSNGLKAKGLRQYRLRGPPSAFQEDHLISLELGGDPVDPRNLWPEPYPRASAVDRIENDLNAQVCSGRLTLAQAQQREDDLKHTEG